MKKGELQSYQLLQLEHLLKTDPPKPPIVIKERWEERWSELEAFAEAHSRLPKRNSGSSEEKSLYSWLNIQYTRANKGKLSRGQKTRIKKLKAQYPFIKTQHYKLDWDERLEEVREFTKTHGRLPGRNGPYRESLLNHWWRNQFRRKKKGRLDFRQIEQISMLKRRYSRRTVRPAQAAIRL